MSGDELVTKMKHIRSDVPVILCTGFSERIKDRNINELGINGILMKPIIKSDLAQTVRKVLDEVKFGNQKHS
jgi:two-component SAPR family response regulator